MYSEHVCPLNMNCTPREYFLMKLSNMNSKVWYFPGILMFWSHFENSTNAKYAKNQKMSQMNKIAPETRSSGNFACWIQTWSFKRSNLAEYTFSEPNYLWNCNSKYRYFRRNLARNRQFRRDNQFWRSCSWSRICVIFWSSTTLFFRLTQYIKRAFWLSVLTTKCEGQVWTPSAFLVALRCWPETFCKPREIF